MYGDSFIVTYTSDPGVSYPGQHWLVLQINWTCTGRHDATLVSRHDNRGDAEGMREALTRNWED